jgi:carbon-monoxide dehydrogenase large subunit
MISAARTAAIGRAVERVEDLRLLRGRGEFADDLHVPGMLHAVFLRSAWAHGRVRSIDTAAARRMPGVHAVYTAADFAGAGGRALPKIPMRLVKLPELGAFEQPVIAHDTVRYVGEPLAMIIADSVAIGEDARDAVELDVEPLVPVMGKDPALANVPITYTASKGEARAVSAPYVRRERFRVQRHVAACMELRAVLAVWDGARTKLTVMGAAKVPFQNRRILADQLDLSEDCIDMIEGDVGGGFGQRGEFAPEDYLVPFAAMRLRRPVKWTEDRLEHLMIATHSREVEIEVEIACERDGTLVALRGEAWVDMGAYVRTSGAIPPRNVAQFLSGPYRVPHIEVRSSMVLTNKTPIGTYRGPGRFEADFFRERLFDMAARDLGIDPVAFRRRNLVSKDEMPYPLATIRPVEKKEELDTGDYSITLDRVLEEIGWSGKQALQGKLIDGRYHGLSVGCFIEGGASGPQENARLQVEPDGRISLYIGSANVGQGLETVCTQITADALGVPMAQVRVFHGSTTHLREGFGSYHSRSVVMGGSAIVRAAEALKTRIREAAAAEGRELTWAELGGFGAEGSFANNFRHTYSYGAAAAHVTVDPRTGDVRVVDLVLAEDIGRVINPLTATGQAIGAMVQGLGGALLENIVYDDQGQFLTGSFADYLLPLASDYPNVRAIMLGNSPSPGNPLGAKGGGEGGVVPIGGLIANAVAAALAPLGVQPRELPLSPPKVWELIQQGDLQCPQLKARPAAS